MSLHTLDDGTVIDFGNELETRDAAIDHAATLSDANGAPVGVWARDGWFTVCEHDPDSLDPSPEHYGWTLHAVLDPEVNA